MNFRNVFTKFTIALPCFVASAIVAKPVKKAPLAKASFKARSPAEVATAVAPASETLDMEKDFARADELSKAGQEDAAILSLTDFLRRYPNGAHAVDAQYLLGEIEFRRRNFGNAIRELKKTLEFRKQKGERVADAYYLIGESFVHLGQPERARIEWDAVLRAYPGTAAATRASLRLMELSK